MEGYHRQRSLWKVVVENVPEPELGEVRAIVGGGLLDQYTELYAEVEMLEEICRDLEVSSTGADVLKPLRSPLTDPPVTKELLRAELQLLLFTIRERAARQGRDPDVAVSCYSPTVVSYALSRCSSPGSQRETPSRSSSRLSVGSCCEAEIEAMKNKLNVSSIEEVVSHLKSVLEDDYEALKREVQYLQVCCGYILIPKMS
uniref:Uncharacterized protein n=1 Tax=Denticeps clupeoides TaxID=299321 RepID=A0AAY4ANU0_9TELE